MTPEQTQESQTSPPDAIEQLMADHQKVKGLFDQFEHMKDGVS